LAEDEQASSDEDKLAAGAEEVGEEGAALFAEQAGDDFDLMVELGVVHDGEDTTAGSGFGIGCGIDEARDAGVEDGSGAHGAGFEGGVEGAVFEAVVFEEEAGFAEGDHFGVGGRVGVAEDSVLASAYDFVFVDDNCAYGDFAVGFGALGFGYGDAEVVEVSHWTFPAAFAEDSMSDELGTRFRDSIVRLNCSWPSGVREAIQNLMWRF
jgi:hypothetical protein